MIIASKRKKKVRTEMKEYGQLCVLSAKFVIMLSFVHKSKSAIKHMNNNGNNMYYQKKIYLALAVYCRSVSWNRFR